MGLAFRKRIPVGHIHPADQRRGRRYSLGMDWVWGIISSVMAVLGSSWFAVVIHEHSHYFTGRAVGVPREKITVRMKPRPPHVALHDDHQWLSPDHPNYVATFYRYQPNMRPAWFYIAAGTIGEALITTMFSFGLVLAGLSIMALILIATSTAFDLAYLCFDVTLSYKRGRSHGDFSALWRIYPVATTTMILSVMALRAAAILVIVMLI